MATVADRFDNWAKGELRWESQVNKEVLLVWFNKWFQKFQKMLLEYASGLAQTATRYHTITEGTDTYEFPLWISNVEDFYSIIQLRVAYDVDDNWIPLYKVCKPINLSDYNIIPEHNVKKNNEIVAQGWQQIWAPFIWDRISQDSPRYTWVDKKHIKIYPTPTKRVTNGVCLSYNFISKPLTYNQVWWSSKIDVEDLSVPRYFMDAIGSYLSYKLHQAENPELAASYYESYRETLHNNIYWFNRDQRKIEEEPANLRYFYCG